MHPTLSTMMAEDTTRERLRAADRHRLARAAAARIHPVTHDEPRQRAYQVLARWSWLR
jgi:hypothetical protein